MATKRKKNNKGSWSKFLILAFVFIKIRKLLFSKKGLTANGKRFLKKEKQEAKKYRQGKESFGKYCRDSASIFTEYFIPHKCNDHKPKILHTDTLVIVAVSLIIIKAVVIGYSFFVYSEVGFMEPKPRSQVVELINQEREKQGVGSVTMNEHLNEYARRKAEDMVIRNYFAHVTPDGQMPWDIIDRNKYPYFYVGENLARDFTSVTIAHEALMASPSHKRNILNKKYTDVGIAVVSGTIGGEETRVLVQLFGTQGRQQAPVAVKEEKEKQEQEQEQEQPLRQEQREVMETEEPEEATSTEEPEEEQLDREVVAGREVVTDTDAGSSTSILSSENQEVVEKDSSEPPSPVLLTNKQELNNTVRYFQSTQNQRVASSFFFQEWVDYLFYAVLALLLAFLIINIVVKISIQHKPVIIQTLLLLIFVYSLIQIKMNFATELMTMVATL